MHRLAVLIVADDGFGAVAIGVAGEHERDVRVFRDELAPHGFAVHARDLRPEIGAAAIVVKKLARGVIAAGIVGVHMRAEDHAVIEMILDNLAGPPHDIWPRGVFGRQDQPVRAVGRGEGGVGIGAAFRFLVIGAAERVGVCSGELFGREILVDPEIVGQIRAVAVMVARQNRVGHHAVELAHRLLGNLPFLGIVVVLLEVADMDRELDPVSFLIVGQPLRHPVEGLIELAGIGIDLCVGQDGDRVGALAGHPHADIVCHRDAGAVGRRD